MNLTKITNLPNLLINFLKEVRLELKRVTWLSRQDTIKNTLIVIGFSLAVAIFLGGLDFIFGKIVGYLIG